MEKPTVKQVLLQMLAEISDLRASVSALSHELNRVAPALRRLDGEIALKEARLETDPQYEPLRKQIEALPL